RRVSHYKMFITFWLPPMPAPLFLNFECAARFKNAIRRHVLGGLKSFPIYHIALHADGNEFLRVDTLILRFPKEFLRVELLPFLCVNHFNIAYAPPYFLFLDKERLVGAKGRFNPPGLVEELEVDAFGELSIA